MNPTSPRVVNVSPWAVACPRQDARSPPPVPSPVPRTRFRGPAPFLICVDFANAPASCSFRNGPEPSRSLRQPCPHAPGIAMTDHPQAALRDVLLGRLAESGLPAPAQDLLRELLPEARARGGTNGTGTVYLRSVTAAGWRGIGPAATL